jgi:hypothetical protein
VAALCLGFAIGPARADDDVAALRGRLDQIKQLVADFETRLNALEAARSSATQPPQSAATAATAPGLATASARVPAPAPASAPTPVVQPPTSATGPAAADAPVVVPRAQWRRVHSGLTMDEVNGLIGAPTKTFELAGKTVWYYYYPAIGAGSVFFDAHGHASSVQRPAGGSW